MSFKNSVKQLYFLVRNTCLSLFVLRDYSRYEKLDKKRRFTAFFKDFYPQIFDKTFTTSFDGHYIYHTAWAARKVGEFLPKKHVDISSSLYFSSIVSAFVPVDFYDYRPAQLNLSHLSSRKGDLMALPFEDSSILSLSCMHWAVW